MRRPAATPCAMILTVTPNTALDHVLVVDKFEPGARLQVMEHYECIGGKGNLVSAFAADLGVPSISLGFAAGENGRRLAALLRARGVRVDFSPAQGETRRNVVVVDRKGRAQTWIVRETLRVNRAAERDLERRVARWLPRAKWLALCGSLPEGCSTSLYRRFIEMAQARSVPVLVDSRGPAMLAAMTTEPTVAKFNAEEMMGTLGFRPAKLTGFAIGIDPGQITRSGLVVCTMGPGVTMAVAAQEGWAVSPPYFKAISSAGSGDAFTAALLAWRLKGADWPEALRWATAAGGAKALQARTDHFKLKDMKALVRRVRIKKVALPRKAQ